LNTRCGPFGLQRFFIGQVLFDGSSSRDHEGAVAEFRDLQPLPSGRGSSGFEPWPA